MLKVGVTGGIGSGKSTVCKMFSVLGIPVFNADEVAKEIQDTDNEVIDVISSLFGDNLYVNGKLDRKMLAKLVFNNSAKLKQLNALIHPRVKERFTTWCAEQKAPFVIKEAAIMIESRSHKDLDRLIVVTAPVSLRILRVVKRDGSDRESVKLRMEHQISDIERLEHADFVISNDKSDLLMPQILKVYQQLCST